MSFACKQALAFVLRPSSRRTPTKSEENKNTEDKPEQAKTDDCVDGTRQATEGRAEEGEENPEVGEQSHEAGAVGGEHSAEVGEDEDEENLDNITPPWEMNQEEVRLKCSEQYQY